MPPDTEPGNLATSMQVRHGPMLTSCSYAGCSTLTMGGTCVEHDAPVQLIFPRGRPFEPVVRQEEFAASVPD